MAWPYSSLLNRNNPTGCFSAADQWSVCCGTCFQKMMVKDCSYVADPEQLHKNNPRIYEGCKVNLFSRLIRFSTKTLHGSHENGWLLHEKLLVDALESHYEGAGKYHVQNVTVLSEFERERHTHNFARVLNRRQSQCLTPRPLRYLPH